MGLSAHVACTTPPASSPAPGGGDKHDIRPTCYNLAGVAHKISSYD